MVPAATPAPASNCGPNRCLDRDLDHNLAAAPAADPAAATHQSVDLMSYNTSFTDSSRSSSVVSSYR